MDSRYPCTYTYSEQVTYLMDMYRIVLLNYYQYKLYLNIIDLIFLVQATLCNCLGGLTTHLTVPVLFYNVFLVNICTLTRVFVRI